MKRSKYFALKILCLLALIGCVFVLLWVWNQKEDSKPQDKDLQEEMQTDEAESTVVQVQDTTVEDTMYEALSYALGTSGEVSTEKALSLLEEAATQNNADAQYFAGEMYLQGIGANQNLEKAAEYFEQAFENGCENAYEIYGKMLFLGDAGICQDYEKAAAVFYSIAKQNGEAACILGIMHTFGMGVEADFNQANAFYEQALTQGYETASVFQASIQDRVMDTEAGESKIQVYPFTQLEYTQKYQELPSMIEEYHEKLKESEHYEAFEKELEALKTLDIDIATIITIFGKENWLFVQNPNDGDAYHDYVGDNAYTEEELASIAKHLMEQKQTIEENGAKFVLLIIPNKEIVYEEYMPTYIERVSQVTKTDKLVEYLRNQTDLSIIYLKDTYKEYKDEYQLYYKTDTHYNMRGSFLAVAELLKEQYEKQISLENTHFDVHMDNYCGDLGVMLERQDRYSTDSVYFMPETSALEEDKVEDSLLLIGDSFSEFLNNQAQYYFKGGVDHVMIMNHNYDLYQATKDSLDGKNPDIVVWECVERYIDRLK